MGPLPWDREICAIGMAIAGLLLIRPLPARVERVAWLLLLAGLVGFAGVLNLAPRNRLNTNHVHQYLGAKYPIPYPAFYRAYEAARDRPPFGIRDLERPPARLGVDPQEQRAWYLEALRVAEVAIDPLAPTAELERIARESGALSRACAEELRRSLPASRAEAFRQDAARAAAALAERDLTQDYGYNGSPFYSLVRWLDPTLHRPLSRWTGLVNLLVQAAAALLLAAVAGAAMGLSRRERLAGAVLLFASWDLTAYALSGLTFGEIWLPAAIGAWAWRRGRPLSSGVAVGWAGLMKLFPLVLLLPAVAAIVRRSSGGPEVDDGGSTRATRRFLLGCLLALTIGGMLSLLSMRSWLEYGRKIFGQFQSQAYLMNSVSPSQLLLALGIEGALVRRLWEAAAWAVLWIVALRRGSAHDPAAEPRRWFLLLAGVGLAVHTWFNYYAIAMLLLLPGFARKHRFEAGAITWALAASFLLPDFDEARLRASPALNFLKVAPYVYLPLRLLVEEIAWRDWRPRMRRLTLALLVLLVGTTAAEAWRSREIRRLETEVGRALERQDTAGAVRAAFRETRLSPRSAAAQLNLGIVLAVSGRSTEAGVRFARAVSLDRNDPYARRNYGRWLREAGRAAEAIRELEAARRIVPWDDGAMVELARAQLAAGRPDDAAASIARARELRPENRVARDWTGD